MLDDEKEIQFTLYHQGKPHKVSTYAHEFPDLRELIMQKLDLDYFGECGGVGRCVTCLVQLSEEQKSGEDGSDDFACQVKIERALAHSTIVVIGDRLKQG